MNRRKWLQLSGMTGIATILGTDNLLKASPGNISKNPLGDNIIRLSSNENPYGPSQRVRSAMKDAFNNVCRYPYSFSMELRAAIAQKHGVPEDHIVMTAGSNEGLRVTGLTYGLNGGEIVAADPVYKALLSYAENLGAYIHRVPLTENLGHDLEAMKKRITLATKLVFVCNPNNPTGSLIDAKELAAFCESLSERTLVFSDEAYFDYIEEPNYPSMVELVKKGMNVIVSRTFSKVYGLAGIRMGYLIARPDIARRLQKNVMAAPNILAIAAASEAMKDKEFYQFSLEKNSAGKQKIYQTLDALQLSYVRSHTNFVFCQTGRPIQEVHKAFLDKGVRVGRPFPPLLDWCRISIGTTEEVDQLCGAMKSIFV